MSAFDHKPGPGTYPSWADPYLAKVPDTGDLLAHLANSQQAMLGLLTPLSDAQWLHRYAPGKWSIKEVLLHLMDAERIFTYRALVAARGDSTSLPGFEEDDYVANSQADSRTPASLLEEYTILRKNTLLFSAALPASALDLVGTSNGHPASARANLYMIAGHEAHHLAILQERYLQ